MSFRLFLLVTSLLISAGSWAQTPPPKPDTRPPNVTIVGEDDLAPQVTIQKKEGATYEEYRLNGRLYKVKVTPDNGAPPYFLVDHTGEGKLVPLDSPAGHPLSVPTWVIGTF